MRLDWFPSPETIGYAAYCTYFMRTQNVWFKVGVAQMKWLHRSAEPLTLGCTGWTFFRRFCTDGTLLCSQLLLCSCQSTWDAQVGLKLCVSTDPLSRWIQNGEGGLSFGHIEQSAPPVPCFVHTNFICLSNLDPTLLFLIILIVGSKKIMQKKNQLPTKVWVWYM